MTASEVADAQHARANRLYWNSSETVDRLAEELGISRNALYASVVPEPAGADCPHCGGELVYPNRTSRTAGRAHCEACDRIVAVDALAGGPVERRGSGGGRSGYEGRDTGRGGFEIRGGRVGGLRDGLAAVEPERAAMIGGAAVLGAVAGVAAVNLLRRLV